MDPDSDIIRVDGLTTGYGEETVLQDVSFSVKAGEIFVILGGSGCGKSTLMRHIIGLEKPWKGKVVVDGVDITACGDRDYLQVLRKIGVLFQGAALFGSMTLAQNVALPIQQYSGLKGVDLDSLVRMKLCMVDLDGREPLYPSELSGGMKKRAGLARALALNPKIVFLDEPSAGLDPITSVEIDELILSINRTIGTTMVIVTHELESIFTLAQRVVMLDASIKGILAEGTPRELKENSDNETVRNFFNRTPSGKAKG
jgi:phospholipid/cholesterol/gamma-HCH transport system ATP-binding protein